MEKRIHAQHLTKSFSDNLAVDDLSLQVRAGEIYGLVGPDGAGKTTTMRLLCGALRPDAGQVHIGGYPLDKQPDKAREQIGYLSQQFSLYEELTVLENLRFFAEVRGIPRSEWYQRAMEILEFVGLDAFADRQAGYLSGGMKQKLGLATALVHRPRVLLLDEPTGGVDPVTRQDFWQLIIRLVTTPPSPPTPSRSTPEGVLPMGEGSPERSGGRGEGISVLVSTPYMDEAVRCTYVGFMKAGRLVVEDTPKALRARLESRIIELRGEPLMALRQIAEDQETIESVQTFGDRIHLRVREGDSRVTIRKMQQAVEGHPEAILQKIEPIAPSLEDVFIALLEADEEA
jgi:ABC-2 type transport system ATP-binding protein